jgi:hypothetical protein
MPNVFMACASLPFRAVHTPQENPCRHFALRATLGASAVAAVIDRRYSAMTDFK